MDGFHRGPQCGGDFGKFPAAQKVKVVANDAGFQTLFLATGRQLKKKGFGEVAGGDSGRVEGLYQGKGLLGRFDGDLRGGGNLRKFTAEKTVLVEVPDDLLCTGANLRGNRG
ncbi:MAG: hypothetical protein EBU36_07115 [Verrucomicrobia bacterium]|nr:hypothetical protein [Verrucomicrobiota bacterium]